MEVDVNLYAIIRRDARATGTDLEAAGGRSSDVGDNQMSDDIRWTRSYVLGGGERLAGKRLHLPGVEPRGDPHAQRADLPVTEIIPISDTVVVRPDPDPQATNPD